jgi:hypothetical protein
MTAGVAGGSVACGWSWTAAAYGAQSSAEQTNAKASSKNPQRRFLEAFAIQAGTVLRLCRATFGADVILTSAM